MAERCQIFAIFFKYYYTYYRKWSDSTKEELMEYILIADDNKDITDILEKYVKKEGYGALIATDGI